MAETRKTLKNRAKPQSPERRALPTVAGIRTPLPPVENRNKPATFAHERPTRRSRKTRRALIDAARDLLKEEGITALTVKAVTERADVGHGTFYHHFPSTESVLAAGIEESMREFAAAMEREFANAEDKSWVFAMSMSNTFRMLSRHAALPWMLERPQVLADAIRDAFGPFARKDIEAMVAAGDIRPDVLERAGRYWGWIIIGALTDAGRRPDAAGVIEAWLLDIVLRILGFDDARVAGLIAAVDAPPRTAPERRRA